MQELEFQVPSGMDLSSVDSAVESICIAEGLIVGRKSALASFPGSVHWHFKRPGESGTLEITSYPRGQRLWASIQDGLRADWIEASLKKIQKRVEAHLAKSAKRKSP